MLDWFFSRPGRFVESAAHRANLENQLKMTPMTLSQLADVGVTPDRSLKLEFFFYTNAETKARALQKYLLSLGYEVATDVSASDRKQRVITGWTLPMSMSVDVVAAWTRQMCEKGLEYDCEFDGWGTTPAQ
jgi:regulator of RNase E activity RraB